MARVHTDSVTYELPGGKRQTRKVQYQGAGGVERNADEIRKILADTHHVRPEQIKLYTGDEKPPEIAKSPVSKLDVDRMNKASLVDLAINEGIDVDATATTGHVREQVAAGLDAKYPAK